jgi:nucleoside-diphosphate-sugar epimerase
VSSAPARAAGSKPNFPKHEDELIIPARDGALRVLRASRDAGVKRVVLTARSNEESIVAAAESLVRFGVADIIGS